MLLGFTLDGDFGLAYDWGLISSSLIVKSRIGTISKYQLRDRGLTKLKGGFPTQLLHLHALLP